MNTTENNKLIAEFMGLVTQDEKFTSGRSIECTKGTFTDYEAIGKGWLHYHTSWDWLMPVVEKIESNKDVDMVELQYNSDSGYEVIITIDSEDEFARNHCTESDRIKATYKAEIEFINWYNENKSNN